MVRAFLSHSSRDGEEVDDLAAFLRAEQGHEVFLDRHPEAGIRPGQQWEQVLYDRLHAADVVVCWVTEHHVASRWCFAEVALAKALGRYVVPVRAQAGIDHPLLDPVQAVGYADPAAGRAALARRLREIEAGGGAAWNPDRPLYPGLPPFEREDAPVFFGRSREVAELEALVRGRLTRREPTAVVVMGASGSGKSSLVRAGLLPRLVASGWWVIPPVLPGSDPLAALTFELAGAAKDLGGAADLRLLRQRVETDLDGVARELLLAAPGRRHHLALVVDQLEEVFTRADPGRAEAFLSLLDQAAEPSSATAVVATMRSEFLTELLASEAAGRLRHNHVTLTPLDRGQLADVVTGPARKGRLYLDEDLVRRLVEDASSGEALPLLAVALNRLTWGVEPGTRVDVGRYEEVGGVREAVRVQADTALARATNTTGLPVARVLDALVALVTLDAAGIATRRRLLRADVPPDVLPAFDVFVDERLLTTDDTGGEPGFAVSHEALFTAWPQLAQAIADNADELRLRRRLETAAAEWEAAARDPSMLWRGEQLRRAESLMEPAGGADREQAFVDAALTADTARRRREADILADRIRTAGLGDRDSELALLLLLTAADQQAITPEVVGALRTVLARHTLLHRFAASDPLRTTRTAVSEDGRLAAAADPGTNRPRRPTTRPLPAPPVGECHVEVWDVDTGRSLRSLSLHGRTVDSLGFSGGDHGPVLTVGIDQELLTFDLATDVPAGAGLARAGRGAARELRPDPFGLALHAATAVDEPTPVAHVDGSVLALRWRDDGNRLAVTRDGRVIDLDAATAQGPLGQVHAVSADGALLVLEQPLRVHNRVTGRARELAPWGAMGAGFSADGRLVALVNRTAIVVAASDTAKSCTASASRTTRRATFTPQSGSMTTARASSRRPRAGTGRTSGTSRVGGSSDRSRGTSATTHRTVHRWWPARSARFSPTCRAGWSSTSATSPATSSSPSTRDARRCSSAVPMHPWRSTRSPRGTYSSPAPNR